MLWAQLVDELGLTTGPQGGVRLPHDATIPSASRQASSTPLGGACHIIEADQQPAHHRDIHEHGHEQAFPDHHDEPDIQQQRDIGVDILPAMNDQDSNRSPEGNVLRFALHRQDQNSQVSTRCHGMPCRGSTLVLPNSVGLG